MKFKIPLIHIKDVSFNVLAFGLYIAIQQIFIMPYLSKNSSEIEFSNIILFITIFNIVSVVLGDELGNTRIIRNNLYSEKRIHGDFDYIYLIVVIVTIALGFVVNLFVGIDWVVYLIYLTVIILGITRYYSMSYYKMKQNFHKILLTNIFYGIGALLGVFVSIKLQFNLAPFLFGEILSLIFVIYMNINDKEQKVSFDKTAEFSRSFMVFSQLGLLAMLMNLITYLDRIVIYPILGAAAMATYYGASSMSKMISLVFNPISGVVLAKLSTINNKRKDGVISKIIPLLTPLIVSAFFGSLVLSYLGVRFLYPQYLYNATRLLVPISLATALSVVSLILRPVIMTFFETKNLMMINFVYAVVFCISMYLFSNYWGIVGFAWASSLGRASQFGCYLWVIKRNSIKSRGIQSNDI